MLAFPEGFLWGTATSSHQVEGDNRNNQWWLWEQQPGRIWQGNRSGKACDWWANAERDFDIMVQLHQNAHRMSLEWSRIEPEEGRFDESAFRRYREMLQGLRDRGIEPMVTLHHFTEPIWFWKRGGWLHPAAVANFQRYVEQVAIHLGDLVRLWATINEPVIYALIGYLEGDFPPGEHNPVHMFQVMRRLALAHGEAYHTLHEHIPGALVGPVKNMSAFVPANPASPMDRLATQAVDYLFNWLPLDAVVTGRLRPPLGLGLRPHPRLVGASDFIGLNYYGRRTIAFDSSRPDRLFVRDFNDPNAETSDITRDGEPYSDIYPEGLYVLLRRLWQRYHLPLYVTENGLPDRDDDQRPSFIVRHLAQVHRAIQEGVDVRGYFYWTLVDNFEWAEGWLLRFGLVELDPETQERRLRPSAHVYAEICRQNGIPGTLLEQYGRV